MSEINNIHWVDLSQNPYSIRSQYKNPPEFSEVKINEISVQGETPSVILDVELPRAPDKYTNDQTAIYSITLQLWEVSDLSIKGFPTKKEPKVEILKQQDSLISFKGMSVFGSFSMTCKSFLIMDNNLFTEEHDKTNRRTLFTYPNVWNTCLLLLQQSGFDLELSGKPDPHGNSTHTSWNAHKNELRLKASNPIELLGLAKIHEETETVMDKEYWWRIEGPDLVTKLSKDWERKAKGLN